EWESEPVFVDLKAFNRESGRKLADLVEQYLRKGQQVYVEGHLHLDQWTSQDGQKQSKLRVVVDNLEFLEPRRDGEPGDGGARAPRAAVPARPPAAYSESYDQPDIGGEAPAGQPEGPTDDIPF